jgi:hypothetical protein
MLDTSQYYPILLNTFQYYKCTVKNLIFGYMMLIDSIEQ